MLKAGHLFRSAFACFAQFPCCPAEFSQFLAHDALGFLFDGFDPLGAAMLLSALSAYLFEQFVPKRVVTQAPSPSERLPMLRLFRSPSLFHAQRKLFAAGRAVLKNAVFTEKPVHTQPLGPFCRRL